jgi:hypothetical protein
VETVVSTPAVAARFVRGHSTLDEEVNIKTCIESREGLVDIHVLDTGSTDRTCDTAPEMGVKVWVNAFESFGQQRNWAIDHMPLESD